jgi:hypothetical protein
MATPSTHSAIARQLAFSFHGGCPALITEPLTRGQVYALPAADSKKLLIDQIVTISELTRRRSLIEVWVLTAYLGDSLIQ